MELNLRRNRLGFHERHNRLEVRSVLFKANEPLIGLLIIKGDTITNNYCIYHVTYIKILRLPIIHCRIIGKKHITGSSRIL